MPPGEKDTKAEFPRRFLVNSMLGQTAKWLRLLGYDAEYVANMRDDDIIRRAKEERRILLTSDEDLKDKASKMGCETLLIEGRNEPERVFFIAKKYEITLEFDSERARCSLCNGELHEIPKASIEGLVPEKVFQRQDRFWQCDGCGKIYWRGTHVEGIKDALEEIKHIGAKTEVHRYKEKETKASNN